MTCEHKPTVSVAQNTLDKLLLKALGLESSALTPTQSVEDALEAFFSSEENRDFGSYISFDKSELNALWSVGIRGMWFHNESKTLALTKALLWAVTELSEEEVEQLFKPKGENS